MLNPKDKILNNTIYGPVKEVYPFSMGLAPAAPLRELGINSLGMARLGNPYLMLRKGGTEQAHTHYHFIIEGAELLETHDADYQVAAGCFVSIPHHLDRKMTISGKLPYKFIYFSVRHDAADPALIFDKVQVARSQELDRLTVLFNLMLEESANITRSASELLVRNYAESFKYLLLREIGRLRTPCRKQNLNNLIEFWSKVENRLEKEWTFSSMARLMNVSKTQFHTLCVQHYGEPPMEHLTRLRMEKAKRLLMENQSKLDDIASQIGYKTPYAFSNVFLKRTGMRPGEFRKSF